MAGAVALVGSSGCLGFDLAVFFLGSLGKLETGIMTEMRDEVHFAGLPIRRELGAPAAGRPAQRESVA
jgi:hypothetical protein